MGEGEEVWSLIGMFSTPLPWRPSVPSLVNKAWAVMKVLLPGCESDGQVGDLTTLLKWRGDPSETSASWSSHETSLTVSLVFSCSVNREYTRSSIYLDLSYKPNQLLSGIQ